MPLGPFLACICDRWYKPEPVNQKAEYRPWTQTCRTDRVFVVAGPIHHVVTGVETPQHRRTDQKSPHLLAFKPRFAVAGTDQS